MEPSSTFSFRLHALTYSIDSLARNVLQKNADVSFPQFLIILCAHQNPGQTQKFTAEWLQLTEATVSYMIKRLIQADYLEVKKDAADGRTKRVYTTKKGSTLIEKLYPQLEQALEPHFHKLNENEREIMLKGISRIHESIKQSNEENF